MSKGSIDHSNSALAATDKIYVHILRSKCRKTPENFFYKTRSARNTGLKGNIDRSNSALAATDKNYRSLQLCAGSNDIQLFSEYRVNGYLKLP